MDEYHRPGSRFIIIPTTYFDEDLEHATPPIGKRIEPMRDYSRIKEERLMKDPIKLGHLGVQESEEGILDRVHDYLGCWRQCQDPRLSPEEHKMVKENRLVIGLDIMVGLGIWPLLAEEQVCSHKIPDPIPDNHYSPEDAVTLQDILNPVVEALVVSNINVTINGIPLSQYKYGGDGK